MKLWTHEHTKMCFAKSDKVSLYTESITNLKELVADNTLAAQLEDQRRISC